jgi:hypothetical protein
MASGQLKRDGDTAAATLSGPLLHLVWGHVISQALHVTVRLGVIDELAGGTKSAADLAHSVGADQAHLTRLLRTLTTLGVVREEADGRFSVTEYGAPLGANHPQSLRGLALYLASPFTWRAWGGLHDAIVNGGTAFDAVYGKSFFAHIADSPEDAAYFNGAMTSLSHAEKFAVMNAYDMTGFTKVVDVGGGHGALLQGILENNPHLVGSLCDLPQVIAGAHELRGSAVADRCELHAMDFFQQVPAGGDLYILKQILHNWNDGQALQILKNCRSAIQPGGRVLHIGSVLTPPNEPDFGKWLDLGMLVNMGGRERTETELRDLYAAAGFQLTRIIPVMPGLMIAEGVTA